MTVSPYLRRQPVKNFLLVRERDRRRLRELRLLAFAVLPAASRCSPTPGCRPRSCAPATACARSSAGSRRWRRPSASWGSRRPGSRASSGSRRGGRRARHAVPDARADGVRRVGAMKQRIVIFTILVVVWSGGVGARLYDLQVRRHDEFARKATSQQQRVVEIEAPRGAIYDARGRELAVSVEVESVFAVAGRGADRSRAHRGGARAHPPRRTRPSSPSGSTPIASSCGWRASSTPKCRGGARSRAAGHLLPEREPALLPDARARGAHARLRRHGRRGPGRARGALRGRGARPVGAARPAATTRCARTWRCPSTRSPSRCRATTSTSRSTPRSSTWWRRSCARAVETSRAASGVAIVLDPRDSAVLTHGVLSRPSTPTRSRATRRRRGRTAPSPTPTSRARPSRW